MIRFIADLYYIYGPLRVFDSITFRAMLGMAIAFIFCLVFGGKFIAFMRRLKATEDVSKPDSKTLDQLHSGKKGTPTMGGLLVVGSVVFCMLFLCDPFSSPMLHVGDIVDGVKLCKLLSDPRSDSAMELARARVWRRLEPQERTLAETIAADNDSAADLSLLAGSLNRMIVDSGLYDQASFSALEFSAETKDSLSRGANRLLARELHQVNREILNLALPGVLRPLRWGNPLVLTAVWLLVSFGLLGMIDDYVKLRGLGKQGLSKGQKIIAQIILASVAAWGFSLQADPTHTTSLLLPFAKWANVHPDLGWAYYVLFVVVIVACSNAVNLTDGLDGLASGCTIMVCVAYTILAYVVGNAVICDFLNIPHVQGGGELAIMGTVMIGAVMGFLWFNSHPAQIFMGDTGSLALGAGIAYMALTTKHELVLIVAGGVFVIEAASVMIQVVSFKFTGKRVFKCAPFHHHLEFSGWHENKVVVRLWILGGILAVAALATLKMH